MQVILRNLFLITVIFNFLIPIESSATIFIVARHAEKEENGNNPALTPKGQMRARLIPQILAAEGLDFIFSTSFRRTMETAFPSQKAFGIPIQIYNQTVALTTMLQTKQEFVDKKILIIGHSNTVPEIITQLGGPNNIDIGHEDYSNLFFIHYQENQKTNFLHLKFGQSL